MESSENLRISVIVPALDEAAVIERCLRSALAEADQVILVDGGSADGTAELAEAMGAQAVRGASRGRASQMNVGGGCADGDILLFLHADCSLQAGWSARVRDAVSRRGRQWGRFDVVLESRNPLLWLVGMAMNLRSRLTGICTGDQAIFLSRVLWVKSGGYARIALMEDIELSRRLKRMGGRPACLRPRVRVSARRWREHGTLRTILAMWWLRALYFLGASPNALHARYYGRPRH
jgi:rSAM/selenodomain-associated transferase 2